MPFALAGGAIGGLGSLFGGMSQSGAIKDAARTQALSAQRAQDIQSAQFNQIQANEQPFLQLGSMSAGWLQDALAGLTVNGGGFNPNTFGIPTTFSYDKSDFENDPAFQSSMKYGQQALERGAAAKGGLLGGAEQKALTQFGTDTANQYYNQDYARAQNAYQQNYSNAFNTFTANRDSVFNKLSSLAGLGLNAAAGANAAGTNFANQSSELALQAGNAAAAGQVGSSNAMANAFGGLTGNLQNLFSNPSFQNLLRSNNGNQSSYDPSGYGSDDGTVRL